MKANNDRGSFLVLTLWSLSLLAAFCVSLGYGVRQKAMLIDRIDSIDSLMPMAYSGIEIARGLIKNEDLTPTYDCINDPWSHNSGLFKEIPMGASGTCSVSYTVAKPDSREPQTIYGMVDEQSKINLNFADAATLTRLFQSAASLGKDMAEDLAYCVIDWRDTDSAFEHPSYGAEEDYYNHLDTPYACKNAPFEVLDELRLVKGMNSAVFDKIKPSVTIYGNARVNVNTASKEVLLALGLEERTVDKIVNYRLGDDSEDRTGDDRVFTDAPAIMAQLNKVTTIDAAELTALETLVSAGKLGTVSTHFMVQSQGVLNKNGAALNMESVIDRKGKIYYLKVSKIQWPSKV